ncbi:hypothetical protein K470DRAFT_212335 [Piedraia hortae CBS 480.64]|uniref:Intermediate filament protein n=1 Tax=Piedraia hortae CBS 480.64 TaxID=1314780 RepID=A0A6A7C6X0_9PEZI|nr:hypothetical protein K470DRAFT_212335 [Piedraia hortae CBS 480.64]
MPYGDNKYVIPSAALAAFVSWSLLTDWLPSLRWIPHAFILGAIAAVLGLIYVIGTTANDITIDEDHSAFTPGWDVNEELARLKARAEYRRPLIFPHARAFSKAVDDLLDSVIKQYVTSWYGSLCSRPLFQHEIDRVLRSVLMTFAARLTDVDLVEIGVSRILPLLTAHFRDFYDAEKAVAGSKLEATDAAVASKFRNGKLHPVVSETNVSDPNSKQHTLRQLVQKIISIVLPGNMKTSPAVLVLIREIVTCAVLTPIVTTLTDPDTWNQLIISIGGPMLRDRKSVRKVRAALDQHAPASSPKPSGPKAFPMLRGNDTERQFERFIRAIRQVKTLSEAKKFRNEVVSQLRRGLVFKSQDTVYLRRLEAGKRLLDQKISSLPQSDAERKTEVSNSDSLLEKKKRASLREIIYDSEGLGLFMEYMNRLQALQLVKFYLAVDGYRYPLEGDEDTLPSGADANGEKMDVAKMYEEYLRKLEVLAEQDLNAVRRYLKAGSGATMAEYTEARRAVLKTQTRVYKAMKEQYLSGFKRSDLYYKWLETAPPLLSPTAGPTKPRLSLDDRRRSDMGFDENRVGDTLDKEYDSDTEVLRQAHEEAKVVRDMQSALDDIVKRDQGSDLFDLGSSRLQVNAGNQQAQRRSLDQPRSSLRDQTSQTNKPSLSSLGLVGAPSTRGVFVDDLFADEAERFAEDEREQSDGEGSMGIGDVREADPGDLGLTEAIDALSAEIEKLNAQKGILDSLMAKAELTNNSAELRILKKSEQSLQREIRQKELQKQQYAFQENDSSLYGRATLSVPSVVVGRQDDGHEYALYVIQVRRQAGESMPAATWAITRRYSQFHELHKRLKALFPSVRELEFPKRQAFLTLQKDFLQKRRGILERYLRSLLLVPAICRSRELRAFLSQSAIASTDTDGSQVDAKDFVARIYNSVSDGMEEFLGNVPVLDQLSVAGQNLVLAATAQISATASGNLDASSQQPEAESGVREPEPFVKPIADLFLETFELNKGNSWLRGRTIVVILHQLLGGQIERKIQEAAKNAVTDASLSNHVKFLKDVMWPGGNPRSTSAPRSAARKARAKKEAALLLGALIPDIAGGVVGKQNAVAASRKLSAVVNNERLLTHLVFTLLDEVVKVVFPGSIP